jgi:HEAT repeat protein
MLSTMIIIGVAMLEELKMKRAHGETFESYRRLTPFLFPLPRFVTKFCSLPLRLIFKKDYPERKREIVAVLAFYTILCLGVSIFYGKFIPLAERKIETSSQQIAKLVKVLKDADNFGMKRRAAVELEKIGEPAMEPLIALLSESQPQVRAYAAEALGSMKSERVISPLIALLDDNDSYVRRTAAASLGRTGSYQAIEPLVGALHDPARNVASTAARALAKIKHPTVIPHLIKALFDTTLKVTGAAAGALGELGAMEAIPPLIQCLEQLPDCPYDVVGEALWKLGSERAVDAWIMGLKKGTWWYPRAYCAAELGKNKLEQGIPALQKAVKDSSVEVRRAAVLSLMEFQSEQTIETLRGAMDDEDFEVRMYAKEALKKIGLSVTK